MKADTALVIFIIFILGSFVLTFWSYRDNKTKPCEYFKNFSYDYLPARCISYYK